jgi:hypothetical protein
LIISIRKTSIRGCIFLKEKKTQKYKDATPSLKLLSFQWGGTTPQWEEEAAQVMHYLQDQLDKKETDTEKERKIQYAKQKQYW